MALAFGVRRQLEHGERMHALIGDHEIDLRLHAEVHAKLKVRVESTTPPPQPVETPETRLGDKGAPARTEKRGQRPAIKVEAKAEGGGAHPVEQGGLLKPGPAPEARCDPVTGAGHLAGADSVQNKLALLHVRSQRIN